MNISPKWTLDGTKRPPSKSLLGINTVGETKHVLLCVRWKASRVTASLWQVMRDTKVLWQTDFDLVSIDLLSIVTNLNTTQHLIWAGRIVCRWSTDISVNIIVVRHHVDENPRVNSKCKCKCRHNCCPTQWWKPECPASPSLSVWT